MWQPKTGPRGTITLPTKYAMCQHDSTTTCPHVSAQSACHCTCHVTVWSYDLYSQLPRQHCTDCTVIKILHVWKNEQIVISFAYGVCLSPFKLCWVRNDEAYAHVCFEVILSTLIFRPSWTHFGSWIHFGSHLPTKTFWSSKRILTSHQVRDRPPHLFSVFKLCPVHLSHQDQL
jgi:hypothetical protein